MREYDLHNDLKACIAKLNPNLDEYDIQYGVSGRHLVNKMAKELSNGNFGKHPKATEELIDKCRNAEDFIRSLMAIDFTIPSGEELLETLREIQNEGKNDGC